MKIQEFDMNCIYKEIESSHYWKITQENFSKLFLEIQTNIF